MNKETQCLQDSKKSFKMLPACTHGQNALQKRATKVSRHPGRAASPYPQHAAP